MAFFFFLKSLSKRSTDPKCHDPEYLVSPASLSKLFWLFCQECFKKRMKTESFFIVFRCPLHHDERRFSCSCRCTLYVKQWQQGLFDSGCANDYVCIKSLSTFNTCMHSVIIRPKSYCMFAKASLEVLIIIPCVSMWRLVVHWENIVDHKVVQPGALSSQGI